MEETRFDHVARALAAPRDRRGLISLLAGAVASAVALGGTAAKGRKAKRGRRDRARGKAIGSNGAKAGAGNACAKAGGRACDPAQARSGANLGKCDLAGAGLVGASLNGVNAGKADLSGARLLGASLNGANLGGACLRGANLSDASFHGANLGGADLSGARVCGADFRGAKVDAAQLAGAGACCATTLPNGASAAPCDAGLACCGHACTNLREDSANCGRCGSACPQGKVCCGGTCRTPNAHGLCGTGGATCLPPGSDVQRAVDGAPDGGTVALCAGNWSVTQSILVNKRLTLVGAAGPGSTTLSGYVEGGGVQVFGIEPDGVVTLQNLTIEQGFAEKGSAVFNQGSLTLVDCVLTNNVSRLGGALYNEGSLRVVRGGLIRNVSETSSQWVEADFGGGALYNDEGTAHFEGTEIGSNQAADNSGDGDGGAVYNYYGIVGFSTDTILTGNQAGYEGGAVFTQGGSVTLRGTTVLQNAAGVGSIGYGGGFYLDGGFLSTDAASRVRANTAGTGGQGGGVYTDGGTVLLSGSGVVTGNSPDNCAGGTVANCTG